MFTVKVLPHLHGGIAFQGSESGSFRFHRVFAGRKRGGGEITIGVGGCRAVKPVVLSVMVTVTLGMTAPDSSATVPTDCRGTFWPKANVTKQKRLS